MEECHESIHVIPPNLLRSAKVVTNQKEKQPSKQDLLNQLLGQTRDKISAHPLYADRLKKTIFDDVETITDLLKLSVTDEAGNSINIAQHFVALFHILFPKNNS